MQRGADGEDALLALFHDDAEYIESFGGQRCEHHGRQAIRAWFQSSWAHQPPDIAISIERVDVDGEAVRAEWICDSSVFATPTRGVDTYVVRDGLIIRLETVVTDHPTLHGR